MVPFLGQMYYCVWLVRQTVVEYSDLCRISLFLLRVLWPHQKCSHFLFYCRRQCGSATENEWGNTLSATRIFTQTGYTCTWHWAHSYIIRLMASVLRIFSRCVIINMTHFWYEEFLCNYNDRVQKEISRESERVRERYRSDITTTDNINKQHFGRLILLSSHTTHTHTPRMRLFFYYSFGYDNVVLCRLPNSAENLYGCFG